MFDIGRKRGQKILLLERLPFFQKLVFSTTSYVPETCSYKFHSNCQNSLWTLMIYSLRFITLDHTRKIGPKTSVIVKTAFFWNVCFYRPLRSYGIDLITPKLNARNSCGPLNFIPWDLSYSILWEKFVKYFFSLERLPFFQKIVYSNNLLGITEWSNNFQSNCQISVWTLTKCLLLLVTVGNTRREGPNSSFFHREESLFLKSLVLDLLGPEELNF